MFSLMFASAITFQRELKLSVTIPVAPSSRRSYCVHWFHVLIVQTAQTIKLISLSAGGLLPAGFMSWTLHSISNT
jgi:hypothetical protein